MSELIAKKVYSKKIIERINRKNKLFGAKKKYNTYDILSSHLFVTLFAFVLLCAFKVNLFISLFICTFYFFLAEVFFFDVRLKKRGKVLEKDATFFFEILSLTLESGSNLRSAIELTANNVNNNLATEFKKALEDMELGKSLSESLNDLTTRIPSENVDNIILNLMEANIYGSNMIESLNNQLDYLNDKILLETRGKINKMPVKISIVSVLIFVPLILLIILSPILITLIDK